MTNPTLDSLPFLAAIRVTGADARSFLQGQLSSDVAGLAQDTIQLASLNSAQGRVQAVLTLVPADEGLILLCPASMATTVLPRLRKYVMRSKVAFAEPDPGFVVRLASVEALSSLGLPSPATPGTCRQQGDVIVVRWHGQAAEPARFLAIGPAASLPSSGDNADAIWRLAEIRAGLPQVLPETHEAFVAQMLNFDLVGGISFTKGCYTGQEIIARTHYRGAIKRRMMRLSGACPPPPPGTRVLEGEVTAGEVVDAAATDSGCELLAVVSLAHKDAALSLAGPFAAALQRLPLPYAVTDPS